MYIRKKKSIFMTPSIYLQSNQRVKKKYIYIYNNTDNFIQWLCCALDSILFITVIRSIIINKYVGRAAVRSFPDRIFTVLPPLSFVSIVSGKDPPPTSLLGL